MKSYVENVSFVMFSQDKNKHNICVFSHLPGDETPRETSSLISTDHDDSIYGKNMALYEVG